MTLLIKSKCFWQYTSDKNIPTTIITCPITFPPDEINGRMLSGMGVPDILGTEGTFTFYTTEPLDKTKDIGGNVFEVKKAQKIEMNLIGPRVSGVSGKPSNVKVPFSAVIKDENSISLQLPKKKIDLSSGQWSDWQEVTFSLGAFKKEKGSGYACYKCSSASNGCSGCSINKN